MQTAKEPKIPCQPKSKNSSDPRYKCNQKTGKYVLKKGFKKVAIVGAPKRPSSAYILWTNKNRESIKASHPALGPKDVVRMLATKWNALSEDEKKPFADQAEQAKTQYKQSSKNFKESHPDSGMKEIIEVEKQKRPLSAYNKFVESQYHAIATSMPGKKLPEISKLLGSQWAAMSAEEKDKFKTSS